MTTLEFMFVAYSLMAIIGGTSLVYYWALPFLKDTFPKVTKWWTDNIIKYMHIIIVLYSVLHIVLVAMVVNYLMNMRND